MEQEQAGNSDPEIGQFIPPEDDDEPNLDHYEPTGPSDEGERVTPNSLGSSGEWFDAHHELPAPPPGAAAVLPSPSVSVSTMGCDQPDVEEEVSLDDAEDMHGVVTSNKSIIMQILSQIRIGMDLTRFAIPVFFLEKRSLLQMYAEFFAHPDLLANAGDVSDAKGRMTEVVRWFLSSISASRKGLDPKKPYNPVLGETFHCFWDLPNEDKTHTSKNNKNNQIVETGPVPYANYNSLAFVAEQVSHHPPISAFYAECPAKRMYVNGTVCTKTKFLGFSVKAQNTGSVRIHYLDHDEEYVCNLPNGYVRSILMGPWFEFGGECIVSCAKSGYVATIEFHTKPFRGGKRHRVTADIKHESEKKATTKLDGEWNTIIYTKTKGVDQSQEVFTDAANLPTIRKKVKTLSAAEPSDSRVVWRHVTEAMLRGDSEAAAEAKHAVEEKQRAEARERQRTGEEWKQKLFHSDDDAHHASYSYNTSLKHRLSQLD